MLLYVVKITGTPDNDMQPHNINSLCEAYDVPFLFKLWDFKVFHYFVHWLKRPVKLITDVLEQNKPTVGFNLVQHFGKYVFLLLVETGGND